MAMSEKERKQLMGLLIAIPIAGLAFYWMNIRADKQVRMAELEQSIDSLAAAVDSAREDLASGSVQALRRRVQEYEASLDLMRQLVPTDAEVANLLDDISNRAKMRDVVMGDFSRVGGAAVAEGEEGEPRFEAARYRFQVFGYYDQIGAFLTDIASLPRIMVPQNLSVEVLNEADATAMGDTTGAMLQASFVLRTFVKPQSLVAEEGAGAGS